MYYLLCWWLVLCVNLTGLRDAQRASKHYFWVYVWGYQWKRLASESEVQVKIFLTNVVGITQPTVALNRTERWRKGKFTLF